MVQNAYVSIEKKKRLLQAGENLSVSKRNC